MNDDNMPVEAARAEDLPKRKPWQAPAIDDVSVAMTAANGKQASNSETGSTKNGS